jgi:hypothetical protein
VTASAIATACIVGARQPALETAEILSGSRVFIRTKLQESAPKLLCEIGILSRHSRVRQIVEPQFV